jgi:hypothetical protein
MFTGPGPLEQSGFLSFFGYDTAHYIESLPRLISNGSDGPDVCVVVHQADQAGPCHRRRRTVSARVGPLAHSGPGPGTRRDDRVQPPRLVRGALGLIDFNGRLDLALCIRHLLYADGPPAP